MSVIALYLLAKVIAFIFITLRRAFVGEGNTSSMIMPPSIPLSPSALYFANRRAA